MNRTNEQLTNEALTRHGRLEICDKHPRGAVFVPATSGLQSGGLPNELTTHGLFPSVFNLIPTGLHTPIRTPIAIWFNPESVVMVVMTSETSHIAQYSATYLAIYLHDRWETALFDVVSTSFPLQSVLNCRLFFQELCFSITTWWWHARRLGRKSGPPNEASLPVNILNKRIITQLGIFTHRCV